MDSRNKELARQDAETAAGRLADAAQAMRQVSRHLTHGATFNGQGAAAALGEAEAHLTGAQAAIARVRPFLMSRGKAHSEQAAFDQRQADEQERTGGLDAARLIPE